jgi:uncharacterized protein YggE
MKKLFFSCCAILLSFTATRAQIAGNAVYNNAHAPNNNRNVPDVNLALDRVYTYEFGNILEANVLLNVKATSFVAIFSLTQYAKSIEEADAMMNNRVENVKRLLAQENINTTQVFTDAISLVPTYDFEIVNKRFSKTLNEVPTGFEMKKNLHITFFKHEQINAIISTAARAEVYDLVKVDYVIDNLDELFLKIREDATAILMSKLKHLEATGIHARFNKIGEKKGSGYPFEHYAQYYAHKTGIAPHFAANYKKGQPTQQLQYNYAEKNKTVYYEKISDRQFDKVINPVVNEPLVQVYISLKGQYEVFDPLQEKGNAEMELLRRQWEIKEREMRLEEQRLNLDEKRRVLMEEHKKKKN